MRAARYTLVVGLAVGLTAAPLCAQVEPYPSKPIRFLVPSPPGGSNDGVARVVAQGLSAALGKSIVVDNRAGGGGVIASDLGARARPDGYTLLFAYAAFTSTPFLAANLPYDVRKDFIPISEIADQPLFVTINPSVPANSIKELLALAKSKPGGLNAGFTQMGSSTHLGTEIFKLKTDTVKAITSVSYKGGAAVQVALLSNEIQISVMTTTSMLPLLKTGKIKALATTAAKRKAYLPDVPTLEESGVERIDLAPWQGILAPAGTPKPIVDRLYKEIVAMLKRPEITERLAALGADPVGSSPAEFRAKLDRELALFAKVIPSLGIKPQ